MFVYIIVRLGERFGIIEFAVHLSYENICYLCTVALKLFQWAHYNACH